MSFIHIFLPIAAAFCLFLFFSVLKISNWDLTFCQHNLLHSVGKVRNSICHRGVTGYLKLGGQVMRRLLFCQKLGGQLTTLPIRHLRPFFNRISIELHWIFEPLGSQIKYCDAQLKQDWKPFQSVRRQENHMMRILVDAWMTDAYQYDWSDKVGQTELWNDV